MIYSSVMTLKGGYPIMYPLGTEWVDVVLNCKVRCSSSPSIATVSDSIGVRTFPVTIENGVAFFEFIPRVGEFSVTLSGENSINYDISDLVNEKSENAISNGRPVRVARERTSNNVILNLWYRNYYDR